MTGERGLRAREQRALAALLAEPTIERAAAAAGVGERTLRRWLQRPAFRDAFAALRRESMRQAVARLQAVAGEAVDTLRTTMVDPDTPPNVRVGAARTLLDHAQRAAELDDLSTRIEALEAHEDAGLRGAPS